MERPTYVEEISPLELTVLGAMWRYRWLVLASVVTAAALGLFYAGTRPAEYVATASLVVEDPRASSVFQSLSDFRPERYVADQIEILRSAAVAQRATEIAQERLAPADLSIGDFLQATEILGRGDSDLIQIRFRAVDPQVAQAAADAIALAYQEVRRSEGTSRAAAALERLDASLADIDADLTTIQARIAALQPEGEFRDELDRQFSDAIARLVELRRERTSTTDPDRLEAIQAELDDLLQQFQTMQVIGNVERQDAKLAALLEESQQAIERKAELASRRDEIAVDAELASGGVVIFSPAQLPGQPSGTRVLRLMAVALLLGGLVGGGLAYFLAMRRHTFTRGLGPELVLEAPLLAEVPAFSEEGIKDPLPVRTAPASAAAEAFRFAAAALSIQAASAGAKSLVMVSATLGDGKTTVAANTAIAAAHGGTRVLLIDADFGDQALTQLLLREPARGPGLTEVVETGVELRDVLQTVEVAEGVRLNLLGRGQQPVTADNFFRSDPARSLFEAAGEAFDLVLIDAPPLLQVAYTSTLLRHAEAAVVVVPHRGAVTKIEEVADRLQFIGIPALGYVYNRAPLRPEMTGLEGSLKDVEAPGPARPAGRHKG